MDSTTLPVIAVIGLVVFLNFRRKRVVIDDNSFAQNGVRVDFTASTITINGRTYPATAVTGIRWQSSGNRRSMGVQEGSVDIEVDDLKKPIHHIVFNGFSAESDAKAFSQRLSVALRKAGGTSFV